MIEKSRIKKDIVDWLEKNRGIFDVVSYDDLIPKRIGLHAMAEMLVDIEQKYGITTVANIISELPQTDEETLGSLTDWFYNYVNKISFSRQEKQLFGIYYASREFAKQQNDPLLDVLAAQSQEEAESIAKISVKDHGMGVHAVSLKHYEDGYKNSTNGSDLKAAYLVLSKEIKDMWSHKNKAK